MPKEKKKYNNPPLWFEIIGILVAVIVTVFIMVYTDGQYTTFYNAPGLKNAQSVSTSVNSD